MIFTTWESHTFATSSKHEFCMKKYLKICNNCLLATSPIVLASGILLESLHGQAFLGFGNPFWTWLHILLSSFLTALVVWHVHLNWHMPTHWGHRFRKHRSSGLKATIISYILTIASGLFVTPQWICSGHLGIGGVHGKIGFAAAFCILLHITRYRRWYSMWSKHK